MFPMSYDISVLGGFSKRRVATRSWGPWGRWSACSVTCGTGTRSRTRRCVGVGQWSAVGQRSVGQRSFGQCSGAFREPEVCNTHPCPGTRFYCTTSRILTMQYMFLVLNPIVILRASFSTLDTIFEWYCTPINDVPEMSWLMLKKTHCKTVAVWHSCLNNVNISFADNPNKIRTILW